MFLFPISGGILTKRLHPQGPTCAVFCLDAFFASAFEVIFFLLFCRENDVYLEEKYYQSPSRVRKINGLLPLFSHQSGERQVCQDAFVT